MTKGKIDLVLDKPYYVAGEMVTGNCQVNITQPVQAAALTIKWKGMERAKFVIARTETVQENGQTVMKTVHDKFEQEKTFFKSQMVLGSFNGGMAMPGAYSFPFQFQLPGELPGGCNIHRNEFGNEYRAAIIYKVKSNLDNVQEKDIKDKRYLTIVPRSLTVPQPVSCHNEKSFLFGGSGKLYMDASIAKNVFVPGETVPIRVIVDNQSKKNVDKLKVKLMRDVKLNCKGKTVQYSEEVNRNVFNGVDKKTKHDNVLNYALPGNIFPSTEGSMITQIYHLDVECDVAMAFDLEVHPRIEVIFMPAMGQPVFFYDNMPKGCWK